MGDSVHGSSRFNRELAGHPTNPAPTGRLLLHCLRLELPTLPGPGATAWRTGTAPVDNQWVDGNTGETDGGSREARQVNEDNREAHEQNGSAGDSFADSDDRLTTPSEPDEEALGKKTLRSGVGVGPRVPTPYPASPAIAAAVPQTGSMVGKGEATGESDESDAAEDTTTAEGLEIYAEPPDDMLAFLRGMSWWEENMIQAAERRGQRVSSPSRPAA